MDQYGNPETINAPRKSRRGWIVLIILAVLLVMIVPVGLVLAVLVFRYSELAPRHELEKSVSMEIPDSFLWGENRTATERLKLTLSVVEVRLVKRAEVPPKLAGSLPGKGLLVIKLKLGNASKGRILDHAEMKRPKLWDNFGNGMRTALRRTGTGEIKPGNAAELTVWAVAPRVDNATDFRGSLALTIRLANALLMDDLKFSFKSSDIQNKQGKKP